MSNCRDAEGMGQLIEEHGGTHYEVVVDQIDHSEEVMQYLNVLLGEPDSLPVVYVRQLLIGGLRQLQYGLNNGGIPI